MELTKAYIRSLLPPRDPEGHKGTFGKVYCLCGAVGYTGAPVLAASAAVRSGSGLVYLGVPEDIWQVVAMKCVSAMPSPLPAKEGRLALAAEEAIHRRIDGCDAVLVGCGLGRGEETDELTRRLLDVEKPLVLDADGINALERHIDALERRRGRITVMTPHEGEFFRVYGDVSRGRESGAAAYAARRGVYLVLKGHRTVVAAPDGRVAVNTTGNSGMAKGGSGDILAGMVLSLLGQGMEPFDACCAAVYVHGLAGDMAAQDLGERGMSPAELLARLPHAFREIELG